MEITVDAKDVQTFFQQLGEHAEEALALGVNRTVEEGLALVRERMRQRFVIRETRMLPPHQLPRTWRATPKNLQAPMQLGDEEGLGLRRRQVFSKFEQGGPQRSSDPVNFPFAAPTEILRPSPTAVIPKSKYPKQLVGRFDALGTLGRGHLGGFVGLGRTANVKTQIKKLRGGGHGVYRKQVGRYFVLGQPGDRFYGIYERTGSARGEIRKLWTLFTDRRIPPRLEWEAAAQQIGKTRFAINLQGAMDALLTGVDR